MWTDGNGFFYLGECRPGDRAATQQEIDAYNAAKAAADAQAAQDAKDITKASKLQVAAAIYFGQLAGKTPAQVKAGIQAVYDSLP